jgi:hypothetical protein
LNAATEIENCTKASCGLFSTIFQMHEKDPEKYSGNDNFTDMSKNMSKAWNKVDKLTRTVFEDLAAEESKQHSEVCKILFFSLKDKSATCLLITLT